MLRSYTRLDWLNRKTEYVVGAIGGGKGHCSADGMLYEHVIDGIVGPRFTPFTKPK